MADSAIKPAICIEGNKSDLLAFYPPLSRCTIFYTTYNPTKVATPYNLAIDIDNITPLVLVRNIAFSKKNLLYRSAERLSSYTKADIPAAQLNSTDTDYVPSFPCCVPGQ